MSNLSKTFDEWYLETAKYANLYYDKYVEALKDLSIPKEYANNCSKVSQQYQSLFLLLRHIRLYGEATSTRCPDCRSNLGHESELNKSYRQYKKWIDRLQKPKAN